MKSVTVAEVYTAKISRSLFLQTIYLAYLDILWKKWLQ